MLWTPSNRFMWTASNFSAPATATPGNNAVGTTVEILSSATVANDVYFVVIDVYGVGTLGAAKDCLVNIRTDPAGGTAWGDVIANLYVSCATRQVFGGVGYLFPLFIKSGSSIGFNAQVNNATVGTVDCIVTVFGKPSRPELVRAGSYVTTFGATTASSSGTAITPGASYADGAYTQLGSNTTKEHWWWQAGFGLNDSTVTARVYHIDVAYGDATNKHLIIEKMRWTMSANEEATNILHSNFFAEVPVGASIFGRATQNSTDVNANHSMIAYGLGG